MTGNGLTRRALRAYSGGGPRSRVHVGLRAATCPLAALDALVPSSGHVVDIGCGHGLLTIRMALASPDRTLLGVDVDAHKLSVGCAAATAAGVADRVRFEAVEPSWSPPAGSADAITIVDVLYLLDAARRDLLLSASVRAAPGGVVLVKEMADAPRWKRRLTTLQEQMSVRLAGITHGEHVDLASEGALVAPLERAGATVERIDLGAGRPHPHLALVARAPAAPVPSLHGK